MHVGRLVCWLQKFEIRVCCRSYCYYFSVVYNSMLLQTIKLTENYPIYNGGRPYILLEAVILIICYGKLLLFLHHFIVCSNFVLLFYLILTSFDFAILIFIFYHFSSSGMDGYVISKLYYVTLSCLKLCYVFGLVRFWL